MRTLARQIEELIQSSYDTGYIAGGGFSGHPEQVEAIKRRETAKRDLGDRLNMGFEACRTALESIKLIEETWPAGSVARGSFEGAFLGVKAQLIAAIKADNA